jgi:hypothetical protein
MDLEHILGLLALYLALVASVLFVLMVVIGEMVIIVRWLKHLREVPR